MFCIIATWVFHQKCKSPSEPNKTIFSQNIIPPFFENPQSQLLTNRANRNKVTYQYEYYRLARSDQDAQKFARKRLRAEELKVLSLSQGRHTRSLGFFDFAEVSLDSKQVERAPLNGMRLTELEPHLFSHFPALREIDLSLNHLDGLPAGVFAALVNLEAIDLSGNLIGIIWQLA